MKTILVPTDFSENAKNTALYAYNLAKKIKANLLICHAIPVLIEEPVGQAVFGFEDYDYKREEAIDQLDMLIPELKLRDKLNSDSFNPQIEHIIKLGNVTEVVNNLVMTNHINLNVVGMTGKTGLSGFLLGSNTQAIINHAVTPLIIVPHNYQFRDVNRIAFATDLRRSDIAILCSVASFAKYFDAEIFVIHIEEQKYEHQLDHQRTQNFLNEAIFKSGYQNICYRRLQSRSVDSGLNWLTDHGQMDMDVIIHRRHNPFANIIKGSHTNKLTKHLTIPLMIFPENLRDQTITF